MWFFRDHQLLVFLLSPSLVRILSAGAAAAAAWASWLNMAIMYKLGTSPSYASAYSHLILPKKEKEKEETVSTHALLFFFVPVQSDGPTRSCNFFVFQLFLPPLQSWGVIFHISLTFFGCCWRFFLPWLIHQVTPPLPYVNLFKF